MRKIESHSKKREKKQQMKRAREPQTAIETYESGGKVKKGSEDLFQEGGRLRWERCVVIRLL